MKKRSTLLAICMMFLLVMSFSKEVNAAKLVKSITIKKYSGTITLEKGESLKLKTKIKPSKATNKKLKWKSSKKKVVSVNSSGTLKAKKNGKAKITVSATDGSGVKTSINVVVGYRVKGLSFTNANELSELKVGSTFTLKPAFVPVNATNKELKWTTSNKNIATVSDKGVVKGIANGTVTIKATSSDGTNISVSKTVKVITLVKKVNLSLETSSAYKTALNDYGVYAMKGTTLNVAAEITPSTASNKKLTWTTSNPKVATVDANGKVTAVGRGVAVINAKSTDGSNKDDDFTVYVSSIVKKEDGCKFVAHRGRCEIAPENSKAALELGLSSNFDAIEFDIWPTIDKEFVVTHNKNIKEYCGVDVDVTKLTLAQATSYKITKGTGVDTYNNEHIPSLEQILTIAEKYPTKMLCIELKQTMTNEMLEKLMKTIKDHGLENRTKIITFYKSNITNIRTMEAKEYQEIYDEWKKENEEKTVEPQEDAEEENPEDPDTPENPDPEQPTPPEFNPICLELLANGPADAEIAFCIQNKAELGSKYSGLTYEQVQKLHENGIKVNVWTIPNFISAFHMLHSMEVDYITSNYKFFE